jgi:hypothetical protein
LRVPGFKERYDRGDAAARSEVAAVTKGLTGGIRIVAGNMDARPLGERVLEATQDEAMLLREQSIDYLRSRADLSDEVAEMIRQDTPVEPHERRRAEQERSKLFADQDFIKMYLAGNREAVTRLTLVNVILARPVKQ